IGDGTYYEGGAAGWRLRDGKEHCGLRIFGEGVVFSVFNDADDLNAGSIRKLVVSADCVCEHAKDFTGEVTVHHGDTRGVLVIVPGKRSSKEQSSARGLEVFWRDGVNEGFGSRIGDSQI